MDDMRVILTSTCVRLFWDFCLKSLGCSSNSLSEREIYSIKMKKKYCLNSIVKQKALSLSVIQFYSNKIF